MFSHLRNLALRIYLDLCDQITSHYLGAAFAASAFHNPSWNAGFEQGNNVGGLVQAVLSSAGGFGNFLTVVVALTVPSACAPTMYTFGSSFMTVMPLLAKLPRFVYAIISAAM